MRLRDFLFHEEPGIQLFCGDCREVLPLLPIRCTSYCLEMCVGACVPIDLVVTDPPYVIGLASTAQEGKAGSWADIMNSALFYATWIKECFRLTQPQQGAAWIFNSWRSFPVLARAAYDVSWPIESLMVWDKQWIGPGGPQGLRPSYEFVALFAHDDFALANRGLPDIWRCQWSSQRPNGHPAEKPSNLVRRIIRESGGAGTVLDPFTGSGTTLQAAKLEHRNAIGIESEAKYCALSVKRLRQEVLPFSRHADAREATTGGLIP